jgi:hypothetical protein
MGYYQAAPGEWRPIPWLRWLTKRANRFRYYGDLYWLHREGILSILVVGSEWTAELLRARGLDPIVPPPTFFPEWGANLNLERDISALWLGTIATKRRRKLLKRLRKDLRERGVELLMIDGVENPCVFGQERTILLNRTRVVVNILRQDWDDNSMRFRFAAQNGALIVTEPTLPHTAFQPGVHIVEVPIEMMADEICYYLSHEEERRQITERAYRLISEDWKKGQGMGLILERIALMRQNAMPVDAGGDKGHSPGPGHDLQPE